MPFQHIFAEYEVVTFLVFDELFSFLKLTIAITWLTYTIQNTYISTGGFCGYFHRDNSMMYIRHPSLGGDQTGVDSFFLYRATPLEMVSSRFYADACAQYQYEIFGFPCNFDLAMVAGVNIDKRRRQGGSEICCSPAWNGSLVKLTEPYESVLKSFKLYWFIHTSGFPFCFSILSLAPTAKKQPFYNRQTKGSTI